MDNFEYTNENEQPKEDHILRLNANDLAEITRKFSGLKPDGKPKASVSYCAYDFDAPEDDIDKNTVCFPETTRIEFSVDKVTGFYTLDLIFKDSEEATLKMMWARLQKHKSNETYLCDKTWIFYMKLMEDEESAEGTQFTADILNPLAFFLIRTVPNQDVEDFEVEPGVFTGGNTIRFLLHRDLVTFQYEDVEGIDENMEFDEEDLYEEDSYLDEGNNDSDNY